LAEELGARAQCHTPSRAARRLFAFVQVDFILQFAPELTRADIEKAMRADLSSSADLRHLSVAAKVA
jgi:hypothetical protein